jgi:hypothetical protein
MRDARRQRLRQQRIGAGGGGGRIGHLPGRRRIGLGGLQHGPQLDAAGMADAVRPVPQHLARLHHAIPRSALGEYRIDQRQDGRGGAEGDLELHVAQRLVQRRDAFREMPLPPAEAGGVGTLEAVDGLLDVAHREDGPRCRAPPFDSGAGEELLGQRRGDAPLRRVAVLRLVQQHVVEPAIQLEQHPGAAGVAQHLARRQDQVVIVHQPSGTLLGAVALQNRGAQAEQGAGGGEQATGAAAAFQRGDPLAFLPQDLGAFRLARADILGGHPRPRRTLLRQQALRPLGPARGALRRRQLQPSHQALPTRPVVGIAAGFQQPRRGYRLVMHRACPGRDQRRLMRILRQVEMPADGAAQRLERPGAAQRLRQSLAVLVQGADQLREAVRRDQAGQRLQRRGLGRAGQDRLPRLGQQRRRIGILDDSELRGEPGFQRKRAQQGLAEGVDGADAHAAGMVQHPAEQIAGGIEVAPVRRPAEQGREPRRQRRLRLHRPAAEVAGQARRHLRRRRLGEGQAQDGARPRARRQQQPQHAIGQHLGLARPGRGADPGGGERIRGPALLVFGFLPRGEGRMHEARRHEARRHHAQPVPAEGGRAAERPPRRVARSQAAGWPRRRLRADRLRSAGIIVMPRLPRLPTPRHARDGRSHCHGCGGRGAGRAMKAASPSRNLSTSRPSRSSASAARVEISSGSENRFFTSPGVSPPDSFQ